MALHNNHISMLEESLSHKLISAELSIKYRTRDNGCLGYPAALILFSIVDTLGSFLRGNEIEIDFKDKKRSIEKTGEHFFVLNYKYYAQNLSETEIKELYSIYRCTLDHNSLLPNNRFLTKRSNKLSAFEFAPAISHVHLVPFLELSKRAVKLFLAEDAQFFNKSVVLKEILSKKAYSAAGSVTEVLPGTEVNRNRT
jgi:hypothetical protein